MTGLHQMMVLTSDFATSSYGESWDSSCEKSWVSVQNHWVPVKEKKSSKLKIFGTLCNQTVYLKTDSKALYYKGLKYASVNHSHNKSHRKYTNGISCLDRLINLRVLRDACYELLCIIVGIFMCQGPRTQR